MRAARRCFASEIRRAARRAALLIDRDVRFAYYFAVAPGIGCHACVEVPRAAALQHGVERRELRADIRPGGDAPDLAIESSTIGCGVPLRVMMLNHVTASCEG
jgi:hypothetical protein